MVGWWTKPAYRTDPSPGPVPEFATMAAVEDDDPDMATCMAGFAATASVPVYHGERLPTAADATSIEFLRLAYLQRMDIPNIPFLDTTQCAIHLGKQNDICYLAPLESPPEMEASLYICTTHLTVHQCGVSCRFTEIAPESNSVCVLTGENLDDYFVSYTGFHVNSSSNQPTRFFSDSSHEEIIIKPGRAGTRDRTRYPMIAVPQIMITVFERLLRPANLSNCRSGFPLAVLERARASMTTRRIHYIAQCAYEMLQLLQPSLDAMSGQSIMIIFAQTIATWMQEPQPPSWANIPYTIVPAVFGGPILAARAPFAARSDQTDGLDKRPRHITHMAAQLVKMIDCSPDHEVLRAKIHEIWTRPREEYV